LIKSLLLMAFLIFFTMMSSFLNEIKVALLENKR
jgi:hypothetical protein